MWKPKTTSSATATVTVTCKNNYSNSTDSGLDPWWFVCTTTACFRAFTELEHIKRHKIQAGHSPSSAANVQIFTSSDLRLSVKLSRRDLSDSGCDVKLIRNLKPAPRSRTSKNARGRVYQYQRIGKDVKGEPLQRKAPDAEAEGLVNENGPHHNLERDVLGDHMIKVEIENPEATNDDFFENYTEAEPVQSPAWIPAPDSNSDSEASDPDPKHKAKTSRGKTKTKRIWPVKHKNIHSTYKCQLCDWSYSAHKYLVNHIAKQHKDNPYTPEPPTYTCPTCGKIFTSSEKFKYHKRSTHSKKDSSTIGARLCPECGKLFKSRRSMTAHLGKVHRKSRAVYPCDICGRPCQSGAALHIHRCTHLSPDELKAVGDEVKPHECTICGHRTYHSSGLMVHMQRAHSDVRRFICEQCGSKFKTRTGLREHRRSHSDARPHVCDLCGQTYKRSKGLKMHKEYSHRPKKPHTCDTCGQIFGGVPSLKKHRVEAHGANGKLHPCQEKGCGKIFPTKGQLRQHGAVHGTQANHECPICHKRFKTVSNLHAHGYSHMPVEQRKCVCELCGSRFILPHMVVRHMRQVHGKVKGLI